MQKFLLALVVILAVGCGAFGVLAWQNTQRANSQTFTFVVHAPEAQALGETNVGAADTAQCKEKLNSAIYAIGRAQGMTDNRAALSDLGDIKNALTKLREGSMTAIAADGIAKQKQANLGTISMDAADKDPMMMYVSQAVDVTSWCASRP